MRIKIWDSLAYKSLLMLERSLSENITPEFMEMRNDAVRFCAHFAGEPAKHHLDWTNAIVTQESNEYLNLVAGDNLRISAPRGSGKSTWIVPLLTWIIGHNPAIRIILTSYAEDIAVNMSVAVKRIIETSDYSSVFPGIRPSVRWRDKSWTIDRPYAGVTAFIKDSTFYAVGMTGAIASRRSDLIIVDDPIRSSRAIRNPQVRKDMVNWWGEVLQPTLIPLGRSLVLSTRYRKDDIHGTEFTVENGWQVISQKAIVINDKGEETSFWEKYMPLVYLLKKREQNSVVFSSQMQNEPTEATHKVVFDDWILRKSFTPQDCAEICFGVDLSSGVESGDYSAIVVVVKTLVGDYYVLDCWRGRVTSSLLSRKLVDFYRKYLTIAAKVTFAVESVGYQATFSKEFSRVIRRERIHGRVSPMIPRGSKEQRLYNISGLIEDGFVFFDSRSNLGLLLDELLNFGYTKYDDLVDAFVYALTHVYGEVSRLDGGSYG